jgi:hypothetical protein
MFATFLPYAHWRIAEAKPMAPTALKRSPGFPGRPIRDARSAEWELMSALSKTSNVRGHGFQMCHSRDCAGDPLMSWRVEPLSLLIFLCGGKESKCRPAQGRR